jgi:hypothetical protein
MATLVFERLDKHGLPVYHIEGIRGSIYFGKVMFKGEPPATIDIPADIFVPPGDTTRTVSRQPSEEQVQKAVAAAEKAAARAAKAQEKADKIAARRARYEGVPEATQVPQ